MNGLAYNQRPKCSPPPERRLDLGTSSELEDAILVAGLLADDPRAWRELTSRYSRLILSCISRVTARFGRVGPEEIREIHATFCLQLLSNDKKKLRDFDAGRGTRLGTWLGLLASHTAYDFLRSVRRMPRREELSRAEAMPTELPDPSEATLQRERVRLVERALAGLSERDRTFVDLYYVQGLLPEQVAEHMGISVKTVYTKKHKLQGRLESLLHRERIAA